MVFLFLFLRNGFAQTADSIRLTKDTLLKNKTDTLSIQSSQQQTADTSIYHHAKDSTIFDVAEKKLYLYGEAAVVRGSQKLTANFIIIDFANSELIAEAGYDSLKKEYFGVPVFKDATNEFSSIRLTYNFKTKRGTLAAAETKFGDGYYYGDKIKRVSEDTYFVKNGVYTTCNSPHPHYYFYSPKMKVIANDKVFADNLLLYVADVPILGLPFSVYFPKRGGKESGIVLPRPVLANNVRGVGLEGLGYFWAGNDYIDNLTTANIYSIGGFTINNLLRFRHNLLKISQSDLRLTYGRTRDNADSGFISNFILNYSHLQKLGRYSEIRGNINYATDGAIRNSATSTNRFDRLNDITTQEISSDFGFNTSGKNWTLGTSFTSKQNSGLGTISESFPNINFSLWNNIFLNITQSTSLNKFNRNLYKLLPSVSLTLPTWRPFESSGNDGVLDDLSLRFSSSYKSEYVRINFDTLRNIFTTDDTRRAIGINPTLSFTPKFGYINFEPNLNYSANIFFRKTNKIFNPSDSTIQTFYSDSTPHYTHSFSMGINFSTKLYAIVQPRVWGINAIRHTLIPRVGFSYRPDFSQYFDSTFNPITKSFLVYSTYETDQYLANSISRGKQTNYTFSLQNYFDVKIFQGDSLEDLRRQFLSLDLSTAYNPLEITGLKWSDISLFASANLGSLGSLSGSASYTLYDRDSNNALIPILLRDLNKGFVKNNYASLTFSTGFSSQGLTTTNMNADTLTKKQNRFNTPKTHFEEDEFLGEDYHGKDSFLIPWRLDLSGNYNYNALSQGENRHIFNINTFISLNLSPTLSISGRGSYDLLQGKFLIPTIDITKDLHCWEMKLTYVPTGYSSGIYFKIGVKASSLQDVKYEYRGDY